jgi:membrane dipeptidase
LSFASEAPTLVDVDPKAFHRRAVIADAHADSLMWNRDLTRASGEGHVDFPRLREAGVRLQCFTLVTHGWPIVGGFPLFALRHGWPLAATKTPLTRARWQIEQLERFCAMSADVAIARTRADLERQLSAGALSAVLGVEGAHALDGKLDNVAELFRLGVRFMGLTHLGNNALGGSSFPLMGNRPLTKFGRDVLDAMAEQGMSVDVAHASPATLADILAHPRARPFCSHTGVRAVANMWRNLDDDALRTIASRGGVVSIIFGTVYLGGKTFEALVRHIEHALKVAGEDAVALGSDFDGMVPLPRGMRDVRDLPLLTEALLARGHSEQVVEKVLGQNLVRFFRESLPVR